jgi:hypothetical protein
MFVCSCEKSKPDPRPPFLSRDKHRSFAALRMTGRKGEEKTGKEGEGMTAREGEK